MSEDVKHTPGPWTIKGRSAGNDGWCVYGHEGYGIGAVWDCNGAAENEANASLIIAAPDLLEALKAVRQVLVMLTEPESIRTTTVHHAWKEAVSAELKARTAIAKAKGQA